MPDGSDADTDTPGHISGRIRGSEVICTLYLCGVMLCLVGRAWRELRLTDLSRRPNSAPVPLPANVAWRMEDDGNGSAKTGVPAR